MRVSFARERSRNRLGCCISVGHRRIARSASGRSAGLGATPLFLRIYSPAIRSYAGRFANCRGSLPARARGAIHPCGKATKPDPWAGGVGRKAVRGGLRDSASGQTLTAG